MEEKQVEATKSPTQVPEENIPLVVEHVLFAQKLARQFYKRRAHFGIEQDDFEAAALLGLCDAAKRFSQARGLNFKTFCYFRIRGTMFDLIRRHGGISRKDFRELVRVQRKLSEDGQAESSGGDDEREEEGGGSLPYAFARTPGELATLAESIDEIRIKLHLGADNQVSDLSYADACTPEAAVALRRTRLYLERLITSLPAQQQRLVELRYWEGLSFEEIRQEFGDVSKSWVSRLHTRALDTLRDMVVADEKNMARRVGMEGER